MKWLGFGSSGTWWARFCSARPNLKVLLWLRLEPGLVQAQPIFHPFLVPPLNRKESQLRISLIICPLLNSMETCVNQIKIDFGFLKIVQNKQRKAFHGWKGDFRTMLKRARQMPILTIIFCRLTSLNLWPY